MVMKENTNRQNSDFMCVCSMCANYKQCLAEDFEQEKFIEEMCLDTKSAGIAVWFTAIAIGIFLGYFWHYMVVKDMTIKQNALIHRYEIAYEDLKNTKEMQAIEKCNDSEYWKAECIAWELNNAGK